MFSMIAFLGDVQHFEDFGADFDEVVDMLEDLHCVRFNNPLHYPGVIGGHCMISNTELLLKSYDFKLIV